MKHPLILPAVTLVLGLAIGIPLGRSSAGRADREATGADSAKVDRGSDGRIGTRSDDAKRDPVTTIRRVSQKLELSPMINMDFDGMFEAYEEIRWMDADELREALENVDDASSNPQIRMMLRYMMINRWAKLDGKGAVEYAVELDQPMERTMGMMSGLMGWMRYEPDAAYAWYQANREQVKGGGMMGGAGMDGMFVAAMAQRDLSRAFAELEKIPSGQRDTALAMMSGSLSMDPERREEFLAGLRALDDPSLRKQGYRSLVSTWAMSDPEAAVAFVESEADAGDLKDTLTTSWAMMDPEVALDWRIGQGVEGEPESAILVSSFAQWATRDPDGASSWLEKQSVELPTDEIYAQSAQRLGWSGDHERAVEWAGKIGDDSQRESALRNIYMAWKSQDAGKAETWRQSLDPALREVIGHAEEIR